MVRDAIERVTWEEFLARFAWKQGEHVTFVGPTGSGKTTLATGLLPLRQFVVAVATKPRDPVMDRLIRHEGYRKIREWPPPPLAGRRTQRVVLWPPIDRPEQLADQQAVIAGALREVYGAGGWCLFVDELWYLTNMLKMSKLLELLWTQGRSINLSIVGGTQRPAWVPVAAYSQATHLFFWRDNDHRNLDRISSLGGLDSKLIKDTVANLPKHDSLYVNTRTGELLITRAPKGGVNSARARVPSGVSDHGRLRRYFRVLLAKSGRAPKR